MSINITLHVPRLVTCQLLSQVNLMSHAVYPTHRNTCVTCVPALWFWKTGWCSFSQQVSSFFEPQTIVFFTTKKNGFNQMWKWLNDKCVWLHIFPKPVWIPHSKDMNLWLICDSEVVVSERLWMTTCPQCTQPLAQYQMGEALAPCTLKWVKRTDERMVHSKKITGRSELNYTPLTIDGFHQQAANQFVKVWGSVSRKKGKPSLSWWRLCLKWRSKYLKVMFRAAEDQYVDCDKKNEGQELGQSRGDTPGWLSYSPFDVATIVH